MKKNKYHLGSMRPGRRCRIALTAAALCLLMFAMAATDSRAATLSVIDAAGQQVKLKAPPRRLVVVGRGPFIPLHTLYMFPKAIPLTVGFEKRGWTEDLFLPLIDPNSTHKIIQGPDAGVEQIAALHPDLVITKASVSTPLLKTMQALDIPVLHLGLENPERFLADIENLGIVLGMTDRADEIANFYRSRLATIAETTADLPTGQRPSTLLLEYSQRGGETALRVPGLQWIQTLQVLGAAGRPVWSGDVPSPLGWRVVGFEQIAAWNPQHICVVVWHRLAGCNVIRALSADDRWQHLSAVSGNRLHLFPSDIYSWDSPDPRWILGMLWLAATLHPERFGSKIDMRKEIYTFFKTLYGIEKAAVDTHLMDKVHLDGCR